MAAILFLNIRSSTHIIRCGVCLPLVSPILFGRRTPGAIILVQHSPLGTGWGPHEDKRHASTTKWYHTTSMVTREFFPALLLHKMLNHVKLGEVSIQFQKRLVTEMYFLSSMHYVWARLGSHCGEMLPQRRQDGAVSPARDRGAQPPMAYEAFYII